eukprot:1150903-Pelagomonas_calceolata.AAC.8
MDLCTSESVPMHQQASAIKHLPAPSLPSRLSSQTAGTNNCTQASASAMAMYRLREKLKRVNDWLSRRNVPKGLKAEILAHYHGPWMGPKASALTTMAHYHEAQIVREACKLNCPGMVLVEW